MPTRTPFWWYDHGSSPLPALLEPPALVWRLTTWLRWTLTNPFRSRLPVVCVGNLTAGGAGKTPTTLALASLLEKIGERPIILTRGYGGRVTTSRYVQLKSDDATEVGDEALLLARQSPTIVGPDRAAGARLAESGTGSVILMDDGFQNPGLVKDLSLVVIDRAIGIGNGQVIPAGPLRDSLNAQLARAHAVLAVGRGGKADAVIVEATRRGLPVLSGRIRPTGDTAWCQGERVVAYAGIGHPEKFFLTLEEAGARLVERRAYPDHHVYSDKDAASLLALAARAKASLVTTEKDLARLEGFGSAASKLAEQSRTLPVAMKFGDSASVEQMLRDAIQRARRT